VSRNSVWDVIVQLHQQPAHHLAAGLPGLSPGKAPGHPPQQVPPAARTGHQLPWQQRLPRLDRVSPVMIAATATSTRSSVLRQHAYGHDLPLP
jgi:hypothetical protein